MLSPTLWCDLEALSQLKKGSQNGGKKKVTFKVTFRDAFPHSDSLIPGHFFLSHSVNPLMKGFLNSHAVYVFGYALCLCLCIALCLLLYVYCFMFIALCLLLYVYCFMFIALCL